MRASSSLSALVFQRLGDTAFSSLIADGIIAGVGSVVIFLPQILILFLFIILLEDSGYLARAAYLMDRAMRSVGLSGQSIIPMISSFACAVPGIMATRVIPNRRDRIATIMAAPFMTCSARLPVYALLIAAFVPATKVGFLNLQGLVLFGLYLFGIVMGILTALIIRKTALRGPKQPFALMLPEFRRPNLQTVAIQLLGRAKVFLKRAGTVIFAVAVVVWALAYFPRADDLPADLDANTAAAVQMEQSWLGRAGKVVEPVFEPLGWDWRVSSAVIAGFPAREVVIAVLGTVYAVGDDADDGTLSGRLQVGDQARRIESIYLADGDRLADFLCVLPAMCGNAGHHSARDQFVALAGFCLGVHDDYRLRRRAARVSARQRLELAQYLRGFFERRIVLCKTESQTCSSERRLAKNRQGNGSDADFARPSFR